jgi:hypothetical protein
LSLSVCPSASKKFKNVEIKKLGEKNEKNNSINFKYDKHTHTHIHGHLFCFFSTSKSFYLTVCKMKFSMIDILNKLK